MNGLSSSLFDAQAGPTAVLVLLVAKATTLLAVGWLVHFALGGKNPRWRVLVWRTVSMGVVVLFALALCPPLWSWAVLPAETAEETAAGEDRAAEDARSRQLGRSATEQPAVPRPTDVRMERSDATELSSIPGGSIRQSAAAVDANEALALVPMPVQVSGNERDPPISAASPDDSPAAWTSGQWMAVIWCAGVVVFLLYRGAGLWHLRRVAQASQPVPQWVQSEAAAVAGRLALRRRFVVRRSGILPIPCLAGILRPIVFLPDEQCEEAYREELPAILAHELAHLKGGDILWSRLLHGLSILLWFHPLAWRMPLAHGDACDAVCDAVAADYMGDAGVYARTLARLALRAASARVSVGLAMARKSSVRRRVEAVERFVFRAGLPRWRRRTVLAMAVVGFLLLGGLALTRSSAAPAVAEDASAADATGDSAEKKSGLAGQQEEAVLTVRCVADGTGDPLEGVEVRCTALIGGKPFAKTLHTNHEGVAVLEYPSSGDMQSFWIKAGKPAYTPAIFNWETEPRKIALPATLDLKLARGKTIGGVVRNEAGDPVEKADVELSISSSRDAVFTAAKLKTDASGRWEWDGAPDAVGEVGIHVKHPEYLEEISRVAASMENVIVVKSRSVVVGRVVDAQGGPVKGVVVHLSSNYRDRSDPQATTDADGRFALKGGKLGASTVAVEMDGYSPAVQEVMAGKETAEVELRLLPGQVLRGRLVDTDGKGIEKVSVCPESWRGYSIFRKRLKTDSEGRFEWNGAPTDEVEFSIFKDGYMSHRDLPLKASKEEQLITLYPELDIRGQVTDAVTGKPVPEFRIRRGQIQWDRDEALWNDDAGTSYSGGQYRYTFEDPMKGWLLQVVAPGYLPATSRVFESTEGQQTYDFKLQPGQGPSGTVLLPDGRPAKGAEVALATRDRPASLTIGRFDKSENRADITEANAEGRFSFPVPGAETFLVIALDDAGFAEATSEELAQSDQIRLCPWGRLEGKVLIGDRPDVGSEVYFAPTRSRSADMFVWNYGYKTKADDQGRFALDRVIAGPGNAYRVLVTKLGTRSRHSAGWQTPVEIAEGGTTEVTIGGTGRAVRGRLELDRKPETPIDWTTNEPGTIELWDKENDQRSEKFVRYGVNIDQSGRFEVPDVPAGDYKLTVPINNPPTLDSGGAGSEIGRAELEFSIAEMAGGRSDEPLDLGTVEGKLFDTLDVDEVAPEFVVRQLDGKPLLLKEYRGKLILLDFWATRNNSCLAEVPNLREIHKTFGGDSRFAMVSISCDGETAAPSDYVHKHGMGWLQAHVVGIGDTVAQSYMVRTLPTTFLIAPDGRVLATNVRGEELKQAVAAALANGKLFDVDPNARPPRFPVTRFDAAENQAAATVKPAVVVLDNTDPKFDRNEPHHDNLRALASSGEELWKKSGLNVCQAVGGNHLVAVDRHRGRIYVCESVANRIHAFTSDGRKVWQIDSVDADTLAVDEKTGDLWCSGGRQLDAGQTVVFDGEGNEKSTFLHRAIDMAYDPHSDSFWLVGYQVINLSREGEIRFQEKVEGWCCVSVSVNPNDGSLWILEAGHSQVPKSGNRLWLRNADGSVRHKIDLADLGVFSVECDPGSGDAWVGIYRSGARCYSAEGKLIATLAVEGQNFAISPGSGEIWMNSEEAVVRIDPSGQILARSPHEKASRQAWIEAF